MVAFHVLRCAQCETFQVLQVTKSQKWKCKLCGQKQSIIKVYGEGTGAECRHHVQKLNTLQGQADQLLEDRRLNGSFADQSTLICPSSVDNPSHAIEKKPESRWSGFLDNREEEDGERELPSQATENKMNYGLQGHVTTDWNEFTKRKRDARVESQKRKVFRPNQHKTSKIASLEDVLEKPRALTTMTTTASNLTQPVHERFEHCRPKFHTQNYDRLMLTEDGANAGRGPVEKYCENNATSNSRNSFSSPLPFDVSDSKLISPATSTTVSKEQKLDSHHSVTKHPQQKIQTKSKPLSQSKWSMYLNQDASEDEGSSDGLEDELSVFQ